MIIIHNNNNNRTQQYIIKYTQKHNVDKRLPAIYIILNTFFFFLHNVGRREKKKKKMKKTRENNTDSYLWQVNQTGRGLPLGACLLVVVVGVHVGPLATVVRIRAAGALVLPRSAAAAGRRRAPRPLGGRARADVDVRYEQPERVGPRRELGLGQRIGRGDDRCRGGAHGHLQRPFGHHFLVRVERLHQLRHRKPKNNGRFFKPPRKCVGLLLFIFCVFDGDDGHCRI